MCAKEMFENFGYKQIKNDKYSISYKYESSDWPYFYSIISFHLLSHLIEFYYSDEILNCITVEELQAINKQIEELNWK